MVDNVTISLLFQAQEACDEEEQNIELIIASMDRIKSNSMSKYEQV